MMWVREGREEGRLSTERLKSETNESVTIEGGRFLIPLFSLQVTFLAPIRSIIIIISLSLLFLVVPEGMEYVDETITLCGDASVVIFFFLGTLFDIVHY